MRPAPLLGAALAVLALTFAWTAEVPPVLVYNGSASAPLGFYRIDSESVRRGDYVLARVPERARALVTERGYLPAGVPLIKRVAGIDGDRICRIGAFVLLNDELAAIARRRDSAGRPLPDWQGCETLGAGRVFLLQDHPRSFDGRYLGPVDRASIVGRATPLWFFERKGRPGRASVIGRTERKERQSGGGQDKRDGAECHPSRCLHVGFPCTCRQAGCAGDRGQAVRILDEIMVQARSRLSVARRVPHLFAEARSREP